jgi:hypothetical protein
VAFFAASSRLRPSAEILRRPLRSHARRIRRRPDLKKPAGNESGALVGAERTSRVKHPKIGPALIDDHFKRALFLKYPQVVIAVGCPDDVQMGRLRRGMSSLRGISLTVPWRRFRHERPRTLLREIYNCCRCIRRQWYAISDRQGHDFRASLQGTLGVCFRTHGRTKGMPTTTVFPDAYPD